MRARRGRDPNLPPLAGLDWARLAKCLALVIPLSWGFSAVFFFGIAQWVAEDPSQIPLAYALFSTLLSAALAKEAYES